MNQLNETRVALISGSGKRRLGNVIARYLAERGFAIALHYRTSEAEAIETRDELRNGGASCETFQADVSKVSDVETMVESVASEFGRIDAAITTASIWPTTSLEEITAETLNNNFAINTLGTFYVARAAGLVMVSQPEGGSIITFGDSSIKRPYVDHAAYFISKGAIPTLTETLAVEFASRNPKIRVNCIHPGPIMFPDDITEEKKQENIDSTLTKSANCPEEAARAVEFLIENKFITGESLFLDGGQRLKTV